MSEDVTAPPDGGDDAPLAGERLAEARRAREVSIQEIANALHLDEYKVRALEQNEFEKLGAPVFAKGYLRKYATLVGISVDDILADYYRLNRATGVPLVMPTRVAQSWDISPGPWLGALTVIIVVAGAAWWWLSSGSEWFENRKDRSAVVPFADEPEGESGPDQSVPADSVEVETTASDEERQADDPAEIPARQLSPAELQPAVEPPRDAERDRIELRLTFTGDCWTEVTDASGQRLYFGLGSAGRSVTMSGAPPLQVLLGNSANASLVVNGSDYPIPRSARRGDTARLTIAELD
jgi:cytoskeleton protein RodZ